MTPMPAETLSISTAQISQNCLVLWASFSATLRWVIIDLPAGGVHPAGASRPAAGDSRTRRPS